MITVLISCKKDLEKSPILVIGHGGMGLEFSGSIYHDNSEEAFKLALDMNDCDGIEMDVHLSADGDLWAYHDGNLNSETDRDGCIENLTFGELNGAKYKGFGSERLKRLKDMNLVPGDKRLFLDVRHFNSCANTVVNVNDYLNALTQLPAIYQDISKTRIILSNPDWVPSFIAAGYHVIFSSDVEADILSVFDLYPSTVGVAIKNKSVSEAKVSNYLSLGKTVYIYEVRSPKKLKEARKKNPTGVMSDDVQSAILELN